MSAKKESVWEPGSQAPTYSASLGGNLAHFKIPLSEEEKMGHSNCWKGGGLRILELFQKLNFLYASPRGTRGNYSSRGESTSSCLSVGKSWHGFFSSPRLVYGLLFKRKTTFNTRADINFQGCQRGLKNITWSKFSLKYR